VSGTVQRRRGQGMDVTPEQVAAERARARMAAALRGKISNVFLILWSPEETEALRATLAGKGVR
jgi:hypothetical protein